MSVRVGEKGQVTIPVAYRRLLGLQPGTEVDFDLRDNELVLRRYGGRGAELVERLRGTSKSGMTTEQLLALTRS